MKTNSGQLERMYDRLSNTIASAEQTLATLENWPKARRPNLIQQASDALKRVEAELCEGVDNATKRCGLTLLTMCDTLTVKSEQLRFQLETHGMTDDQVDEYYKAGLCR